METMSSGSNTGLETFDWAKRPSAANRESVWDGFQGWITVMETTAREKDFSAKIYIYGHEAGADISMYHT
ncbi:hypothetical protein N7468_005630 [Penicillium chermesinum]|uniref:Uncharacterized protein n=1 Tax=Penicillium chermesinum TaxID=63820 RepID=A0A9W9TPV8_9EURO|nr:uncharacterized protein N7468_005630 [Penicillium chermesinum]KAJ5232674.1 hypothetical protein N7468_005630 [Penicillium chermesinum]KAJ6172333.1 hypothetical protein N7470_001400 [Penicillium chermesinum]